jgi:molybdopterin-guanine dinucleotide biosynthesis protein B
MGPLDLVILEGFKSLDTVSRVLIPRDASEFKALANGLEIAVSGPHVEELPSLNISAIPLSRIGDLADVVLSKAFPMLPGLNCKGCGYESCRELALAIISGEEDAGKCIKHVGGEVSLQVDGRKVATNPFVQKVMRNVVSGIIRTLKGIDNYRRVEVAFDQTGEEHD